MSTNLLVLGPQGSGKGTQAKLLCAAREIPHISTGDMFRGAIADGTALGKQVEPILASGALVPDELTVALIRERLGQTDAAGGFVLDGFPRNLAQAEALDAMLSDIARAIDAVLFFDLDDAIATRRMLGRAAAEGRADDTPEVIAKRLAVYHEQTEPLVEYYRERGVLVRLDAELPVEAVQEDIGIALGRRARGDR
jgi:adenylate kinase